MTSAQIRIREIAALLPSWVDLDSLREAHNNLNKTWANRGAYFNEPVAVEPIERAAPPELPRNPDPISEMTCGEREYKVITCKKCGKKEQATGSRQIQCIACKKKATLARQAVYKEKQRRKAGKPCRKGQQ